MNSITKNHLPKYFEYYLVNKLFKILPLYEEANDTLYNYIDSLAIEIAGIGDIIDSDVTSYVSLVATLNGLKREIQEPNNKAIIKRETFKCIDISKSISENLV